MRIAASAAGVARRPTAPVVRRSVAMRRFFQHRQIHRRCLLTVVAAVSVLAACSADDPVATPRPTAQTTTPAVDSTGPVGGPTIAPSSGDRFPDVVAVDVTATGDTFRFSVTISSPYDTPERYADAWRVLAPNGDELAIRELTHDHQSEQPFTRSLDGVEIPDGIESVTVQGRDQANGWGGATVMVAIAERGD